jgi:hypothetical protein
MEEAKERLRYAIDLDKDIQPVALDDEDPKPSWDWIGSLKIVDRAFQVPDSSLFSRSPQLGGLGFRNGELPRAIGRFMNQQAAVVSGPHVSRWRSSQTRAKDLCFVANSLSLISSGVAKLKRSPRSRFLQETLKTSANRSTRREERQLSLVNDCIGHRMLDGRQNREGKAQKRTPASRETLGCRARQTENHRGTASPHIRPSCRR